MDTKRGIIFEPAIVRMHGARVGHRAKHVQGTLMNMSNNPLQILSHQTMPFDYLQECISCRMGVTAGGMPLEGGFGERPAAPQPVDQSARIRVDGHARSHSLGAFQNMPGAREPVCRQTRGSQTIRSRLGGMKLF